MSRTDQDVTISEVDGDSDVKSIGIGRFYYSDGGVTQR